MTPSTTTTTGAGEQRAATGDGTDRGSATGGAWRLVARREMAVKLRDKSFILSTLFTLVLIIGVFGFQAWNAERDRSYDLVATAADVPLAQQVAAAAPGVDESVTLDVAEVASADEARDRLAGDEADAWLHREGEQWVLTGQDDVPSQLEEAATQTVATTVLADNARAAGVDVSELQRGTTLQTDLVEGDGDQQAAATGAGLVMAILFYISAILFGMTLANSVVEEKQSRIVEIIATAIPVRQLLVGKIAGNTALAVGQLVLYGAVAVLGVSFTPFGDLLPSLSSAIAWFVLFFLAGFTTIAAMYAMAGALASRTEDVQYTATPVTTLLMLMFFGALLAGDRVLEVLQWVPPFSAIVMPMQIVQGSATWWQAGLALAVLVLVAAVVLVVTERIYRRALLQTSGRMGYREAWTAEV